MIPLLITLGVFLLAVLGLSLGTLLAKKPLRGSCGGMSALRSILGLDPCESCSDDPEREQESCSSARRAARKRQSMDV